MFPPILLESEKSTNKSVMQNNINITATCFDTDEKFKTSNSKMATIPHSDSEITIM